MRECGTTFEGSAPRASHPFPVQIEACEVFAQPVGIVGAAALRRAEFVERGALQSIEAVALLSGFSSSIGQRGLNSEKVAEGLADEADAYLRSDACVAEHPSDQLLLPMALAGGGAFTVPTISEHLRRNARLIEKFLPVEIAWSEIPAGSWRITVAE